MRCPFCGSTDSRVLDSRPVEDENAIRRRRECQNCGKRFTTWEKTEVIPLTVVKKDGARVPFDSNKIMTGVMKACYKRSIPVELLRSEVSRLEQELNQSGENEISSAYIGEKVMDMLKGIDQIAYVRFASVYREFKDAESFMDELRQLLEKA
ncbi:MAG: transcriptional regulator NrdR [Eubacteriaceae bacterium]|jgi:transcriptional repressor NrdR